jgi:choline dehydrogenase
MYDYIVVGGGPAGCAVASRLSRQPGCRVLLIEAGRPARNPLLSIPAAAPIAMRHPRYTWTFATEAEPGLNGRSWAWHEPAPRDGRYR